MFRCLAHLGVVVMGLAVVVCWGCAERSPKGTSPAKNAEQGAKGIQPAAKEAKPAEENLEKPAAGKSAEEKPKKPAPKEAKPAEEKPEKPAAAEAGSTSGRGGRAVGKVLKRLMEKSERRSGVAPVTGKVTFRGHAVEGARVSFVPTEATAGKRFVSLGTTDSDGRFSLSTFTSGDGAVPGSYKVLIANRQETPDPKQPDSPDKIARDVLPPRYGNASRSELRAEVKRGTNHFEFVLTD